MTIVARATDGVYATTLFDFVGREEEFKSFVYHDTRGIPTIGYGTALLMRDPSDGDRWVVREDIATLFANVATFTDADFLRLVNVADRLNHGDIIGANQLTPAPGANASRNIFSFTIDTTQGRTVFDRVIPAYQSIVETRLGSAVYNELAGSKELVALVSLAYNLPGLIGNKLVSAIQSGDRAEAWYQIRYQSNLDGDHAARRYREAQKFSLYNDVNSVSLEEAENVYRMYTRNAKKVDTHRQQISYQFWPVQFLTVLTVSRKD